MIMRSVVDPYTLKARVYPGLLILMPPATTLAALFPSVVRDASAVLAALGAGGMLYLLSHIVRRAGKSKEPSLWRSWGGKPTTVGLRWATANPRVDRELIRERISRLVPDVKLPSAIDEAAAPAQADRQYEAAVSALREMTRDANRFPVVFAENVSYGFRRNTWAVKRIGLLAAASAASAVLVALVYPNPIPVKATRILWGAAALDAMLVAFWIFVVSGAWVREAADAYTDALFAATATLSPPVAR